MVLGVIIWFPNDYGGFFCVSELPDIDDDDDEEEEGGVDNDDDDNNVDDNEVAAAADDAVGFTAADDTAAHGASVGSPDKLSDDGLAQGKTTKHRKRIREEENEHEGDDEVATKVQRRRWSSGELGKLFQKFGKQITIKTMPTGQEISEFARLISHSRTVAQIRTQIHNIIHGKVKCLKKTVSWDPTI